MEKHLEPTHSTSTSWVSPMWEALSWASGREPPSSTGEYTILHPLQEQQAQGGSPGKCCILETELA